MSSYRARLFRAAATLRRYLAGVGLDRFLGRGLLLRTLTRDGFLATEIDGKPAHLWWTFAVSPYEPYMTELCKHAIRPGATVLDLGAHFGYYATLAGLKVGKHGRVYAFEPAPSNFAILTQGLRLNGFDNVYAVQRAVSDRTGTVRFLLSKNGSTVHGIYGDLVSAPQDVISVECTTIDDVLSDRGVNVVKMDVQGHELHALRGMARTLERSPEVVLFAEWSPGLLREAGVAPGDLLRMLQAFKFKVHLIDEQRHALVPLAPGEEPSIPSDPLWYTNLYCVKTSREARTRWGDRA